MPSLSGSLTRYGGWYERVGLNRPQLGRLQKNYFATSKTFVIPGYLLSSIPSLTVMMGEQDWILPLMMDGV